MPGSFGNFMVKTLVRSPLHSLLGERMAVITVEGRKTHQPYSTPINVIQEGEGYTVTSLKSRTWWRNLRAGCPATLELGGRALTVQGEVLETPSEVVEGLRGYFSSHPELARYFGAQIGLDGELERADLDRLAQERVVIHLRPVKMPIADGR